MAIWTSVCSAASVVPAEQHSLPRSAAAAGQKLSFCVSRRQGGGARVRCLGLALKAESPQQVGPRGVKQVIVVQAQPIDQRERSGRTVHFADRARLSATTGVGA